jgi:hypothetical protein
MPRSPDEERFSEDPPPDEPPRRRREYDDEDEPDEPERRIRRPKPSWIDYQMLQTPMWLLVFFALCCNGCLMLPLIFGIVGWTSCKDPDARDRAKIVTIISAIMVGLGVVARAIQFALVASNPQAFGQ